ncbi:phage tail tape measure protein [Pseudomonas chlororaphis]|uniref:phage tail tape measure protein n=1 Tax=Pseudomonas chlororaphis TaxID=587753 RepID=UPI0039E014A8
MAKKVALGLVIGGAVDSTVGKAFKDVESKIKHLDDVGAKARVLQNTIGDTIRLREEWRKAHASGAEGASKLLNRLEANLDILKKQGVEVGRLNKAYTTLGRVAAGAELKAVGHRQIEEGRQGMKSSLGQAGAFVAAAAIPTKVSADYQAIIRDIAIKSDIVNKPQEAQLSRAVIGTARDTGMSRNDVADLINQLVGAGMDVEKAIAYAPTAAKFAIGQGASGVDTAAMIQALQQNAKITDPKVMQQALEAIAYQGQAGSFEASDMAKWFPQLLAGMEKGGVTGLDAVTSLGAMLQVQMKTAGSSDEAANNFKNWMEKIGSGDIQRNYEKAGIDYQKSLNTGLQKGMNVFEASMGLAVRYVEKTDPKKAQQLKEAQAKIDKEVDPQKATAALEALEKSLRTGDVFADMQVKAALTAYAQNRGLYSTLKADSADAKKVAGILDKNLAERRETSSQIWKETFQSIDDGMRSVGDAIRPVTDAVGEGITNVSRKLTELTDESPRLVSSIGGVVAGLIALKTAASAIKIGKGLLNVGRGTLLGNPNIPQKVIVTNLPAGGLGGLDGGVDGNSKGSKKSGRGRGFRGRGIGAGVKAPAMFAAIDAGFKAKDTYDNAVTQDEKAEGYGEAAGGLAGTLAGAAAGAAIGSVVPVIGNVVGGLVGGYFGGMGGDYLGGSLGKSMFGSDESLKTMPAAGPLMMVNAGKNIPPVMGDIARSFGPASMPAPVISGAAVAPGLLPEREADAAALGDVARSLSVPSAPSVPALLAPVAAAPKVEAPRVDQRFDIQAPLYVTVQGDVKDPAQLAQQLQPFFEQHMRQVAQQLQSRTLYDEPHV